MVQIQSTWFPLIDRNPQVFTNIYDAKETDFRPATQRIYRSGSRASHLVVPIVPPGNDRWRALGIGGAPALREVCPREAAILVPDPSKLRI